MVYKTKRINDEITNIRNSSIIKLGELSCIVEDPLNKNIFYICSSFNNKTTKCILFMKYVLDDQFLDILYSTYDKSVLSFSNIHTNSFLTWENNLLAVSSSNTEIIFYYICLNTIQNSNFIENSERKLEYKVLRRRIGAEPT